MSNLTRFNPFNELIDPLTEDFFKSFSLRPAYRLVDESPQMKLDVKEDDKSFMVKVDMPGVSKDDIKVLIDSNQISVSAEVHKEKEEKEGAKTIRSERYYGKVYRNFSLGESVDQAAATAKYEDGVLELMLPKRPSTQSRLLKVA